MNFKQLMIVSLYLGVHMSNTTASEPPCDAASTISSPESLELEKLETFRESPYSVSTEIHSILARLENAKKRLDAAEAALRAEIAARKSIKRS